MVGENGKKKRFDREFKISAVKMVTEAGHRASEVARSLGIHPNMLYNWKRKYADNGEKAFVGKGHLTEISKGLKLTSVLNVKAGGLTEENYV